MSIRSPLRVRRSPATGSKETVSREQSPGLDLTVIRRHHFRELHLTLHALPGEKLSTTCGRLQKILRLHQATIVKQDCFGALTAHPRTLRAVRHYLGPVRWPIGPCSPCCLDSPMP